MRCSICGLFYVLLYMCPNMCSCTCALMCALAYINQEEWQTVQSGCGWEDTGETETESFADEDTDIVCFPLHAP